MANKTMKKMGKKLILFLIILGIFIISFGFVSAAPTNISSCGNITIGGEYALNQSISSSGTCLNVSADNVVLDGNGHNLTFNTAAYYADGINLADNRNNITIKNFNIYNGNSTLFVSHAIFIQNGTNIVIDSNNFFVDGSIYFVYSSSNNVSNNNISISATNCIRYLISSNDLIFNNNMTSCGNGVLFDTGGMSFNAAVYNNYVAGGIQSYNSSRSRIYDNIVQSFNYRQSESDYLSNNTIITGATRFLSGNVKGANNFTLFNQIVPAYLFSGLMNMTVTNSTYGSVFFYGATGSGSNLVGNSTSDIIFGNNYIYVNGSKSGLNKSSNITLYNIPGNFSSPAILRDGITCPSSICTQYGSLNSGNVTFSVTGWSNNYSIGEGVLNSGNVYDCGIINQSGNYTLQRNLVSNGTCFTILADNVTLNFSSYSITGNTSGYGVYVGNNSNSNLNLGNILSYLYKIYLYIGTNNHIITNSDSYNITLNGTGTSNLVVEMSNSSLDYTILYDGIACSANPNCTLNSNSNGIMNFSLNL